MNSFHFCLFENLFISLSILNDKLAGYRILGCKIFPFSTLNTSCHSLLFCKVSAEKSVDSLMEVPLYVTLCFSLAAFKILYLKILPFQLCYNLLWVCLDLSCLGLFMLPVPGYMFPSSGLGSFWP